MRRKISFLTFILLLLCGTFLWVGFRAEPGTYLFPIKISPVALSGTFGELRTNHFHSGIDVKTGGQVGKPLYAIEDGYVYRLKVSPFGFGKAIYLRHADGRFSVYAHLNGFHKRFEEFIYRKQYATKRFEQELYLSSSQFPVKKGEIIAYSGNSGSSTGPHLHFEIREPDERILNPLKYYPGLITDHKKPSIGHLAIEPLSENSRVNGKLDKLELNPQGGSGNYSLPGTIKVQGPVGIEYHAWDILDAAPNHCGINYVQLELDGEVIYEMALDRFAFDEKKNINVHFDYPFYKKTKRKYQRCYRENGNEFNAYRNLKNSGVIRLTDDLVHEFRLELRDLHDNATRLTGRLQRGNPWSAGSIRSNGKTTRISSEIDRDLLRINLKNPVPAHLNGIEVLFSDSSKDTLKPAWYNNSSMVFIQPLGRWKYPHAIHDPVTGKRLHFHFTKTVYPLKNNIVEADEAQFYFPYKSVFDTLHLEVNRREGNSRTFSGIFTVGSQDVPLFKSFVISFQPEIKGKEDQMVVAWKNRWGNWQYIGSDQSEEGAIYASSGYFGEFTLMADSVPPSVRPANFSSGQKISSSQRNIAVRISDNFSGIDTQRILLTLDGAWILGEYDAKTGKVVYNWKERPLSGKHILEAVVYDNAGNPSEKKWSVVF